MGQKGQGLNKNELVRDTKASNAMGPQINPYVQKKKKSRQIATLDFKIMLLQQSLVAAALWGSAALALPATPPRRHQLPQLTAPLETATCVPRGARIYLGRKKKKNWRRRRKKKKKKKIRIEIRVPLVLTPTRSTVHTHCNFQTTLSNTNHPPRPPSPVDRSKFTLGYAMPTPTAGRLSLVFPEGKSSVVHVLRDPATNATAFDCVAMRFGIPEKLATWALARVASRVPTTVLLSAAPAAELDDAGDAIVATGLAELFDAPATSHVVSAPVGPLENTGAGAVPNELRVVFAAGAFLFCYFFIF
jgi:hypothetical protein